MPIMRVIAVFVAAQMVVVGMVVALLALAKHYGESPYVVGPYKTAGYVALALSFVLDGVLAVWMIHRQRRRSQASANG
ncbi:hypothetical protein [Spongiactinospora sp. TRM90649]|uniref:hypothetical protein n=1 Tax=Spongiactinospora sp. TRM90649 TaxID=3031114 RepID=UPI0023F73A5C|nr:hypothetical protein [Spongiactinospora sp. TRM90649]MDF5753073.1 hypothetical protein [Spongiactinospora sp. TRM90649]